MRTILREFAKRRRIPPLCRRIATEAAILLLLSVCLVPDSTNAVRPGTAEFIFFDVGQGDAALVRTETACILIDAGPDLSEERLTAELHRLGVSCIDCLFLTHAHEDHIGGADRILQEFEVGAIIARDTGEQDAPAQRVWEAIAVCGAELYTPTGITTYRLGDLWLDVVVPFEDTQTDGNDNSLILRVSFGETRFLYMGDAESDTEALLLSAFGNGDFLDCDGLKLGHHGSRSSSGADFLRTVSPGIAVASAGGGNSYGHPHGRVLADLAEIGCVCRRTDEQGTIRILSDGTGLREE